MKTAEPKLFLDAPAPNALVDPLTLRFEGWLHLGARHAELESLQAFHDGSLIGETRLFLRRPDVAAALSAPEATATGFAFLAHADNVAPSTSFTIEFKARLNDESDVFLGEKHFKALATDYRTLPYGNTLTPKHPGLLHREHIYGSGPSVADPSPQCLAQLRRFLPAPPAKVLDLGCGIGAYARPLLDAGYDWLGVEVKDSDCAALSASRLPHRKIDGRSLPFGDDAFDAAIAIEVLEHIADLDGFLREARRVAPRLIISVPNIELIPYLFPYVSVPWHLLEADHKNFFTRWSLADVLRRHFRHVEIFNYGEAPLRTADGAPLHYHLLALANR